MRERSSTGTSRVSPSRTSHNPTRFLCHARVAERFRSGRVLLAGDAAHACSPTEGHGMNTGLQDAYNLGWKLAHVCRGEAGEVLVDSYDAERRPVAQRIVETGAAADAAQARLDQRERANRNAALAATFSDPDAVQLELASGAEVDRYYDRSPVVSGVAQPGLAGPAAGRLLPLTAPVRAAGRPGGVPCTTSLAALATPCSSSVARARPPPTWAPSSTGSSRKADREFVDAAYGFVVGDGPGDGGPAGRHDGRGDGGAARRRGLTVLAFGRTGTSVCDATAPTRTAPSTSPTTSRRWLA